MVYVDRKIFSVHTCSLQSQGVLMIKTILVALWTIISRGDCQLEMLKTRKKHLDKQI